MVRLLDRREFVIVLGTGLAIVGYNLMDHKYSNILMSTKESSSNVARPSLQDDIILQPDGDFFSIRLRSGKDSKCGVNYVGKSVIQWMNGQNTIEDVSKSLSRKYGIPDDDALKANVALFVSQVGLMGLLKEPFYSTIFERTLS